MSVPRASFYMVQPILFVVALESMSRSNTLQAYHNVGTVHTISLIVPAAYTQ